MKPTDDMKKKHPGIETAMVGCCSEACRTEYAKDEAKYDAKVVPQWQTWKEKQVK